MATLRAINGVFIVYTNYAEIEQVKGTGLIAHFWPARCDKTCHCCRAGAGKGWYTTDPDVAAQFVRCDPDGLATRAIEQARQQRAAQIDASHATNADVTIPAPAGLEYLPYQKAGIAYAIARKGTLFGDEPGLGKTVESIGFINAKPDVQNVLVLCPATLRLNWQREAERWLTRPFTFWVAGVSPGRTPPPSTTFVITNYDRVRGVHGRALHDALLARQWDVLIADECHALGNPKSQQSQAVLGKKSRKPEDRRSGLSSRARYKLYLSGTPFKNRPIELQPVAADLCPDVKVLSSYWHFAKKFCAATHNGFGWDVSGASNLEELQALARQHFMIRRKKEDVLRDLPSKRRQIIILASDEVASAMADERAAFDQAVAADPKLREFSAKMPYEAVAMLLKSQPTAGCAAFSRARKRLAVAKVPYVIDHIENLLSEGVSKVIVFAHHHDVEHKLMGSFGSRAVTVTGEVVNAVNRQRAIDRFQTDPSCQVFIGGIRSAGVGITLTASSNVVFAELDPTPAIMTQCEDRAHRIGQQNSVLVQHLIFDRSLDAVLIDMLIRKQAVADQALDRKQDLVAPPSNLRPSKSF